MRRKSFPSIAVVTSFALFWHNASLAQDAVYERIGCNVELAITILDIGSNGQRLPIDSSACRMGGLLLTFGVAAADTRLSLSSLENRVRNDFRFFGLAGFYSTTSTQVFAADSIGKPTGRFELGDSDRVVIAGRYAAVELTAPGAEIVTDGDVAYLRWQSGTKIEISLSDGTKTQIDSAAPSFEHLRYFHLWDWLGSISRAVEWSLSTIRTATNASWGWVIVLFALLLKVLMLPVGIITARLQSEVSEYQTRLAPRISEVKRDYDGEEAHKRIMAAHKALGISPFFMLKPMLGSLIQVPILIAVFNALGEMPQLVGESFLWITDLAYPDSVAPLTISIPLLGNTLNLLPIVMTIVTIASTLAYKNSRAPASAVRSQKLNLYLMAGAFFVFFYPFPAAMVLYWTLANILQFAQQQFLKS